MHERPRPAPAPAERAGALRPAWSRTGRHATRWAFRPPVAPPRVRLRRRDGMRGAILALQERGEGAEPPRPTRAQARGCPRAGPGKRGAGLGAPESRAVVRTARPPDPRGVARAQAPAGAAQSRRLNKGKIAAPPWRARTAGAPARRCRPCLKGTRSYRPRTCMRHSDNLCVDISPVHMDTGNVKRGGKVGRKGLFAFQMILQIQGSYAYSNRTVIIRTNWRDLHGTSRDVLRN